MWQTYAALSQLLQRGPISYSAADPFRSPPSGDAIQVEGATSSTGDDVDVDGPASRSLSVSSISAVGGCAIDAG